MDKFAENILELVKAVQPYAWILIVVGLVVIGIMFAIPSDKVRDKAKASAPWILIGTILVAGAVYLGNWIFSKITF